MIKKMGRPLGLNIDLFSSTQARSPYCRSRSSYVITNAMQRKGVKEAARLLFSVPLCPSLPLPAACFRGGWHEHSSRKLSTL